MSSTPAERPDYHRRAGRRKRTIAKVTINMARFPRSDLEAGALMYPDLGEQSERPKTRGECAGHEGPCPWISCAYHLYVDVAPRTGSITLNFPDVDVEDLADLPETCALDVADRGGVALEDVGAMLNVTREAIRLIEGRAVRKLRRRAFADLGEGLRTRRHLPVIAEDDGGRGESLR